MAETLKEAIAEEEAKAFPERRIFMIQFKQKVFFNLGPGRKSIDRYDATAYDWDDWNVDIGSQGHMVFESGRRKLAVPVDWCVVEWRDACPRCHVFIALKSHTGHCPNHDCTWPKAEIFHCPECQAQLKPDANYCPNKACRWGWKDPDADPNEGDETLIPKDTRATITGVCEQCDSQMRNGHCPLGCDTMREPEEGRSQWPTNKEA